MIKCKWARNISIRSPPLTLTATRASGRRRLARRSRLKRMGSGEWGMGNGEWGMGNGEKMLSPFPIPHSPLPLWQIQLQSADHIFAHDLSDLVFIEAFSQ